jgi:hypothetical protein
LATTSMMPPGELRRIDRSLFTQPRRRGILRTSPFGHSPKFALKEFSEVDLPEWDVLGSPHSGAT